MFAIEFALTAGGLLVFVYSSVVLSDRGAKEPV